jgi:hypothetical protein
MLFGPANRVGAMRRRLRIQRRKIDPAETSATTAQIRYSTTGTTRHVLSRDQSVGRSRT